MPAITDTWLDAHRVDPAALADAPLIGIDHVANELRSLAARFADPELAARLGAEIPTGIVLMGPTGVGKSFSARALARLLGDVPTYEVGADELDAPLVRRLFPALAARHPRSILVIDEIDLVGGERTDGDAGSRRTLAALLTALDGLRSTGGVLVVAATSRARWEIDAALLRAGRLGFTIEIERPHTAEREALLRYFLAGRPTAEGVDHAALAVITEGWTPAELRAACADAAGITLAAGRSSISHLDLIVALTRAGRVTPPPSTERRAIDRARLWRVCVREAGRAVLGAIVHGPELLTEVSIGPAGGMARYGASTGEEGPLAEGFARDAIVVAWGPLAADRMVLGDAALENGTDARFTLAIARQLVASGLEPGVAPFDPHEARMPDRMAAIQYQAIGSLLSAARERAASMLAPHRGGVIEVARWLEAQTLTGLAATPMPDQVRIDVEPLREVLRAVVAGDGAVPGPADEADDLKGMFPAASSLAN